MNNEHESNFWIIDAETLNELQILKAFVNFVVSLKYATESDRQIGSEINYLIKNLDKPETFKDWNIALDIFDFDIMYSQPKKQGIYWRTWAIYFESDTLEIEAKTNHSDEPLEHYGDDFYYHASIFFKKNIPCDHIYIEKDLKEFVADAMNYTNYITPSLNEIKIDIYTQS